MFVYDAQIASQPDAVQAVLDRPAPPRLDPARPLIFAGLGTSLHAARVAAAWAGYPAQALDAHELALRLPIPRGRPVVAGTPGGAGPVPGAGPAEGPGGGAGRAPVRPRGGGGGPPGRTGGLLGEAGGRGGGAARAGLRRAAAALDRRGAAAAPRRRSRPPLRRRPRPLTAVT